MTAQYRDWGFTSSKAAHTETYLGSPLFALAGSVGQGTRVLDVGCGVGSFAGRFIERGCTVVGIDLSEKGIVIARKTYPQGRFEVLPADANLLANLGEAPFDLIISTEVVEHLYDPRSYVRGCFDALRPGGRFILTTPYHGYLKNLVIALSNKWDTHANPLWDGGHIKLWSRATLSTLLAEAGFANIQFRGAGRIPLLYKSMVLSADRPQ